MCCYIIFKFLSIFQTFLDVRYKIFIIKIFLYSLVVKNAINIVVHLSLLYFSYGVIQQEHTHKYPYPHYDYGCFTSISKCFKSHNHIEMKSTRWIGHFHIDRLKPTIHLWHCFEWCSKLIHFWGWWLICSLMYKLLIIGLFLVLPILAILRCIFPCRSKLLFLSFHRHLLALASKHLNLFKWLFNKHELFSSFL